ncbi:sodium/potassium-transporting ATPase subunit beta-like isoform X2 [Physella acuta]|uniref:sodium/potassium-transporting ATPase subunit beta-like isoform X2 n=1 Tax=Physella acuta TaxID=109671 RepID=UPI0027DE97B5|nr:sodium/potassium-transporting ATPase subunit beta-like isoform X2 [Physella acuta]
MEKPTFQQKLKSLGLFLWNGETKEFLGRGGRSWAEISLFYLVYYACLAGFFAATIAVFYETIDIDNPRLQGDSSLLKGNPGMGFQPMPDIDTTLIYARSSPEANEEYVKSISKVLKEYKKILDNVDCTGVNQPRPDENIACRVNYSALTEHCNEENRYGMAEGKPCILLKLNKIYGWIPNMWTVDEAVESSRVPQSIKENYAPDRIWVHCHGENPGDNDNMGATKDIVYYPQQGFPLAFYPYKKQRDYRSPLVFVKFNAVVHHVGIMIECTALAKNINVDRSEKEGSVHFELLVEP